MDSSDDEFFDAEDNLDNLDSGDISGLTGGCKLVNRLDVREILSTEGTEFEIEKTDITTCNRGDQSIQFPESGNIFKRRHSPQTATGNEVLKNVDIDICYDEIENTMDSILPCGGIKKLVLQHGLGDEATAGQTVYIHYFIFLEGVDEPIDNTMARQQPIRFKIGSGSVIPVLDIGTRTMSSGETSKFLAKPEFAFGLLGSPPRIPPDSRAMVTIRLLKVQDDHSLSIREMSHKQRADLPFNVLFNAALEAKDEGNTYFREEKFLKSIRRYQIAKSILGDAVTLEKEVETKKQELICILFSNVAQCYLQIERYDDAIGACKMALNLPVKPARKSKAYYRYSKALLSKGMPTEAKNIIERARALDVFDADVHRLQTNIIHQIQIEKTATKHLARRMFCNNN